MIWTYSSAIQDGGKSVWVTIDNDTRKQIKDFILASLASEENAVKNLAANVSSLIILGGKVLTHLLTISS